MIRNARWRRSRLLFLFLFTVIIAAQTAWCQASPQQSKLDNPQKKWQLKFSLGADFIPRQFDGLKIYLQREISENKAVRFGIGVRGYTQDTKRNDKEINPIEDRYRELERDTDLRMIALDINYIGYFKSRTAIRPYFGIGPYLNYSLTNNKQLDSGYGDGNSPIRSSGIVDRTDLVTGLTTIMGAEWCLSPLLVLQVEYSLKFYYERYRRNETYHNPFNSPERNSEYSNDFDYYRIGAGYIRTGVSIVF